MVFDRDKFWDGYRKAFGKVTQRQVDAIEFLLAMFDSPQWKNLRHIAYALATIKHETADTFRPIKEYRNAPGSRGRKNQDRYWLSGYYGRGYVQLTWLDNYKKAAAATGFDLINKPDLAMDPTVAFQIMTWGMHNGAFTGQKLSNHINGTKTDYHNARKIINRLDKAAQIARYAKLFETILKDSAAASSTVLPDAPIAVPAGQAVLLGENQAANTVSTPQPNESVVIEKEEQLPLHRKIWKKLTGWVATLGGTAALKQNVEDIQSVGLPGTVAMYAIYVAAAGFVLWLLYEISVHLWEKISKRWLTTSLIKANTTATNVVTVAEADKLDQLEREGWVIVRRK